MKIPEHRGGSLTRVRQELRERANHGSVLASRLPITTSSYHHMSVKVSPFPSLSPKRPFHAFLRTCISLTRMVVSGPTPGGTTLPNRFLCLRLLRTSYTTPAAMSSSAPTVGSTMAMGSQLGEPPPPSLSCTHRPDGQPLARTRTGPRTRLPAVAAPTANIHG
ncbi:hypothetical protein Vretimale_12447, partial [Volvox reticuliferus]